MNPPTQPQPPPPPQQQQPPPLLLQPNRPSTSCPTHPQEIFTGFCPSCLFERLSLLDPNNNASSSSTSTTRKPPTSSTAAAALKAIFRPSTSQRNNNNNRPPTTSSNSFFPELRRTKSFSASKNELFAATFEPQRKSCDVRGRSTLYSLFNQADERKIPKPEPPTLPEVETVIRNQACSSSSNTVQQPFIEEDDEGEEDTIVVEDSEGDEIRVLEPPQLQQRELSNVIEESFHEIVEEEPEFQPEREPELVFAEEESLKPMKEHMDLDAKKSSGRDLKEIAGSFWSAASVFSKKLQKWRQKQKAKKRGPRNGAVSGSSALLPVEKPIGRQFRETQSEIADYGFGRRSCDTDPRFSLDIARMSFDDPRYSFDEPRASWDGYLIGKTVPRMPLPTMLSVVEDAPVHVLRTDSLIPVEEPPLLNENGEENVNFPGNQTQTKEYYSDSSTRRRKSLDRSSSIRKTAAAVVAEMDELKPVSNAKVTPATASVNASVNVGVNANVAGVDYLLHGQKVVDRDLRDYSNSNSNSNNSLRDDCSESFELGGFRDNASVVGSNNVGGDRKGGSKKSSSRWKAWSIWGFIHRRGGGNNNKEEEDDRCSSRGGNCNGVERSYSESWQEFRGERNGDVRGGVGIGSIGGGGNGFNRKMLRSNSSVSWRNAPSMGGGGIFSGRKSDVQGSNGYLGRKGRDEFVLERNRSARYSPTNNMDNGLLRLYLTPGSRRNGASKGRSSQAHSIARSVLRLY
ncbi:protein OCTOPUS [Trifolium pratense]|uniref:protein OCTOPUS n=1 Tax=Trifolium pratense TaxID=57577 RepID=UPI001E691871|nr:protein OCTOPUS [Trifolium pratense]